MPTTFGEIISQARKNKGYSQKQLEEKIGIDITLISRLENDRAYFPPTESTVHKLAFSLNLNFEELIYLTGRIPKQDSDLLKRYSKMMVKLFREIENNSQLVSRLCKVAPKNSDHSDSI